MRYISTLVRMVQCLAIDRYYTYEVKQWGFASYETKTLRHYYIQRLCEAQLKEFARGEEPSK